MIWINEGDVPIGAIILIPIGLIFILCMVFGMSFFYWTIALKINTPDSQFFNKVKKRHIKKLMTVGIITFVGSLIFFPIIIELSLFLALITMWMFSFIAMKLSHISAIGREGNISRTKRTAI